MASKASKASKASTAQNAQNGKKVYNTVRPALSGVTLQQALIKKQALSVTSVPNGYIKVAQLHVICKANFCPISKMVKAIGGDRAMLPAAHPIAQPVYFNNVRYVNAWLGTKTGIQCILTGNWQAANAALKAQQASAAKKQASKQASA